MSEQLIVIPKCKFTSTSMTIADTATKPEWMAIMSQLKEVDGALQFWIGDGLRFGIQKLYIARDRYDEAEAITGLDRQTLRDDAWVAGEVDPSMRRADLSYQHHKAVAPLEPKEQKKWLDMAEKEGLSYRQLREAILAPSTIKKEPRARVIDLKKAKLLKDIGPVCMEWPEFAGVVREINQL
jgi:hypothetical protein